MSEIDNQLLIYDSLPCPCCGHQYNLITRYMDGSMEKDCPWCWFNFLMTSTNRTNTMTKAELINAIQEKMGGDTSSALAGKAVDAMLEVVFETLKSGGEVKLTGIGTLYVKATSARKGRNPQTGEELVIPAGKKVSFSVAKAMKDALK